jgi:copper chaperone CopZ
LQSFKVSSNTNTTSWKQIMFSITRSNGPTIANCNGAVCTGLKLYQGGVEVPGTMYASGDLTAAAANTITVKFIPDAEEEISGNAEKTYELKATNVGGTVTAGHYISTNITNPSVTKTASAPFARYATAATTLRYYAAGATVAANDIRQSDVVKVVAAQDATTAISTAVNNVQLAYGLTNAADNGKTVIVTGAIAAGNDLLASIGGTLESDSGFTCTAWGAVDGGGAQIVEATGEIGLVRSIKCVATGKQVIFNVTGVVEAQANVNTITLTVTDAGYANGDVVVSTDSDVDLALTGSPAAPTASFIWSDVSAQSHSIVTSDWATDYLIKSLATDSQTLQGSGS